MTQVSRIIVNIARQQLYCAGADGGILKQYAVSTSRFGVGNQNGSFKTPLGEHCIEQKIGAGCAINEVFVGRQAMGGLEDLRNQQKPLPDDIIMGRILWLSGLQPGINRGEGIDSYQRYIVE